MSTLVVSNFSDGSISVPATALTEGSAKSWGSVTQTGTQSVDDSYNIASITDDGTGLTTFNLSNNHASGDYVVSGTTYSSGSSSYQFVGRQGSSPATTSYDCSNIWPGTGSADATKMLAQSTGDLA